MGKSLDNDLRRTKCSYNIEKEYYIKNVWFHKRRKLKNWNK